MSTAPATAFLTVDDVATSLQLKPATVRRFAASGDILASKIGGQWRFDPEDVRAFFREKDNRDRRKRRRAKETHKALREAVVLHGHGRAG